MKIAILGLGLIADAVAPTIARTPGAECWAVAARDQTRAEAFAKKHGFQKAYGSYEAMLKDPDVELVYVATPHSLHAEHMKLCMEHGKAVLCEKAFTLNAKQAKEIAALSEKTGVFAAEAMWTRYMPSRRLIQEVLESGIIGPIHMLTANLSYDIDAKARLMDPVLAGGALLDVGVYGVNFALMHFGNDIEKIESSMQWTPTGVDAQEVVSLHYRDGRMAVVTSGLYARGDRKGIFHGEKGYVVVENINNPNAIRVYDDADRLIRDIPIPKQISGYEYEFIEAMERIAAGEREAASMPQSESVTLMERLDEIRAQWGLVYPQEK